MNGKVILYILALLHMNNSFGQTFEKSIDQNTEQQMLMAKLGFTKFYNITYSYVNEIVVDTFNSTITRIDTLGRVTAMYSSDNNHNERQLGETSYSKTGKLMRHIHFNNDGSVGDISEYYYNEIDSLIMIHRGSNSTYFQFENRGDTLIQKEISVNEKMETTTSSVTYMTDNNRVRRTVNNNGTRSERLVKFDQNGRMIYSHSGYPSVNNKFFISTSNEIKYDSKGRISSKTITEFSTGTAHPTKFDYFYRNDLLIKVNRTKGSNEKDSTIYEYNASNQLIKVTIYDRYQTRGGGEWQFDYHENGLIREARYYTLERVEKEYFIAKYYYN